MKAHGVLSELVAIRDAGLRVPLPLPVAASADYAQERHAGRLPEDAYEKARAQWESGYDFTGEDADPEHLVVWGDEAPFKALREWVCPVAEPGTAYGDEPGAFARLARRVWQPLFDASGGPG